MAYAVVFVEESKSPRNQIESEVGVTPPTTNEGIVIFNVETNTDVSLESFDRKEFLLANFLAERDVDHVRRVRMDHRNSLASKVVRVAGKVAGGIRQNLYPAFIPVFSSRHDAFIGDFQLYSSRSLIGKGFGGVITSFYNNFRPLRFRENIGLPLYSSKRSKSEAHTETADND